MDVGAGVTLDASGVVRGIGNAPEGATVERLAGRALMPGFVNAHSHVFQRLLRGTVEARSQGADFWSWRRAMYDLAERLDPDALERIAHRTYAEMLRAGWTRVLEFHYLHHQPGGAPYADPQEMALRLVAAAQAVGIDLEILRVAYLDPQEPAQRRFSDRDLDTALSRTDDLRNRAPVPVGIAPHSLRAVPPEAIGRCARWAREAGAACHAHVSEQPAEVRQMVDRYGARPVTLLERAGALGPGFVAVHATHLDDVEVRALGASGAAVCLCPTTEANLGDGPGRTADLLAAGCALHVGTDSQAEIDPFIELRLLEYNARNLSLRRRVLDPAALLRSVTEPLVVGRPARLLAVDLGHPRLAGLPPEHLAAGLVMSATSDCVAEVIVGTRRLAADPRRPASWEAG